MDAVPERSVGWHHPIAFGLLERLAGNAADDVLTAYLHQAALGMIGAGFARFRSATLTASKCWLTSMTISATWLPNSAAAPPRPPAPVAPTTRSSAMSNLDSMLGCSDPNDGLDAGVRFARPRRRRPSLWWGVAFHNDPGHDHMGRPGPARYAGPSRNVFTLGVAGPVGSGRRPWSSALPPPLARDQPGSDHQRYLHARGCRVPLASRGVAGGADRRGPDRGCPHTAIRDDAKRQPRRGGQLSAAISQARAGGGRVGGDNLTAVFSRELADRFIFIIDVAEGDKIPRKGGQAFATAICS